MSKKESTITTRLCDKRKKSLENWCSEKGISLSEAARAGIELVYIMDELEPDQMVSALEDGTIEDSSVGRRQDAPLQDEDSCSSRVDYNNISRDAVVDPGEADFSDTEVVSQTNRSKVLAGAIRWHDCHDEISGPPYSRYHLRQIATNLFDTSTETVDKYIHQLARKGVLHPHTTLDERLCSPEVVQELRNDIAAHYYERGATDAVFNDVAEEYEDTGTLSALSGTYDPTKGEIVRKWYDATPQYFRARQKSKQRNAEYVQKVLAREYDDKRYCYSSRRILSRMLAIGVDDGIWTPAEARDLMRNHTPFSDVVESGSLESAIWGTEQ
ncbi:hypothetical protein [Halorientalis regularis]|uniref:Uncharacterized protein n=1 Tax=Halorientalis regularis TaxID=660518 RepID=A0A1G7GF07_9EURY|nr:hypothetical protein [Halorientalis regularis]SDE86685.1 hypothetical protein SAMN05216218_10212 [Halorientalis regularis]